MQHRVDGVLFEERAHRGTVADAADHERGIEHRLAEAARQVIEHHHALAVRPQLQDCVAADVARASGD